MSLSISRFFSKRPGCGLALFGAIFMLLGLVLLAIAGYQMLQMQKYRSGQCTITAKQLQHDISTTTHTNSNGGQTTTSTDVYAPSFKYTVHAADGRSYTASGYDGSDAYTSDHAGQQAIVDHYNIGQSYQCWYNPANPVQAVLVRQPNWLLLLIGGVFLLVGTLFAALGMLLFQRSSTPEESSDVIPDTNEFYRYE